MKKISIGIIGFGIVGQGTVQILLERKQEIIKKTSLEIVIKKICDLQFPSLENLDFDLNKNIFTKNINDILDDQEIDIVIELIGGINPAKDFIKKALQNKKNVVTANKHLLAYHGNELFELAKKNKKMLLCEASICGAIPCLRTLRQSVTGLDIKKISGIFNGTANFILSRLQNEGGNFREVLEEAQKEGYAEADPTFDIEGIDAAHKVAVISNFAFGTKINFKAVKILGISNLNPEDFDFAKQLGYKIKLIAKAEKINDQVFLSVRPAYVKQCSELGQIDGVLNAVYIEDKLAKPILLAGAGAGGLDTGTAVVSDIVEIAIKEANNQIGQSLPFLDLTEFEEGDPCQLKYKTVFRAVVTDGVGILEKISGIFASENVSITNVHQYIDKTGYVSILMILDYTLIANVEKAAIEIAKFDFVNSQPVVFPVEE